MVEAAREQIELYRTRSAVQEFYRKVVFEKLLPSRSALQVAGGVLYLYQITGLQKLARFTGILRPFGKLAKLDSMSPTAEIPFFYSKIGRTYRAVGERRFRVAFVAGCIANVAFARLNEATVRVLQRNHCEVVIPAAQNCCGALHLHSGYKQQAQDFARRNIDAFLSEDFDAILTNAAGCGSTLKEYDHLLADDPAYAEKALKFKGRMEDVTRFLSAIELNEDMGRVDKIATYQDSCHLAHGQGIKMAPRKLLKIIPGLQFREMPMSDICCGSAGVYNVVQPEMATTLLQKKMETINGLDATLITTANPGCMLQLSAGVRLYGRGQKVAHVVEVLDEAYKNFAGRALLRTRGLKRFF
jgi:glycolate oxidase iron-sulfur subunit